MSSKCVVIDYGSGNVFSVMHALRSLGIAADLSRDPESILAADSVILPGVGAFGRAAERLRGDPYRNETGIVFGAGRT